MMSKKNGKTQDPEEKKNGGKINESAEARAGAAAAEETPPEEKAATAAEAEPVADNGPEKADGKTPEEAQKQEISETDMLKAYVEQALREIKRLKDALAAKEKEAEDRKAEALRFKGRLDEVVAEYDNFRRRTAQEKENLFAEAVVKSVSALLPAFDSLEKAVEYSQTNIDTYKQGVEMTLKQMRDGFQKLGVTEIEAQGAEFDPEKHNAIMHVEDDSISSSVVTGVFQKGYAIGDRVIRHSVVKVAN